jgi:hypothetical protein
MSIDPTVRSSHLALFIALTACAAEPDLGGDEQALRPEDDCPRVGCGMNTNWMGRNLYFHEVDGSGNEVNDAGLRFVRYFKGEHDLAIDVVGGELRGWTPWGELLDAEGVIGTVLELELEGKNQPELFHLRIDDVVRAPYWIDPYGESFLYKFLWQPADSPPEADWIPYCDPDLGEDELESIQGLAFVFTGDRYGAYTKTVTVTEPGDPWFNLTCVGTAPAKLQLLRHTTAASHPDVWTSWKDRQAILKMLTADYCGRGTAFTRDGMPIRYMDRNGYLPRFAPTDRARFHSVDAIFDAGGAYCIGVPRLWYAGDTGIAGRIAAECAIPTCTAYEIKYWEKFGRVISVNPTPP